MNRSLLLAITTVSALALSSACVIKESSSSTSGTGGTSGVTNSSSSQGGAGGQGGAAGVGGGAGVGGAGQGGGGSCVSCNQYIYEEMGTQDDVCASSVDAVNALGACACGTKETMGACVNECVEFCVDETQMQDNQQCFNCMNTLCTAEANTCLADLGD